MKFINYIEKRKFDDYWENEIICKAGSSETDIGLLYAFDWDWYKSRRHCSRHNISHEAEGIEQVPYGAAGDLWDLFIMHIADKIPVKDIARSQECSVSNITKRLRRIFLLLRNNINQ